MTDTAAPPDWQAALNERGAAVIESVVSAQEVSGLLQNIERSPMPRSRAGIRHVLRHPAVQRVAQEARFLGLAQAVLGPTAFPFRATLFDKSSQSNWLVVWHQDTAIPIVSKIDAEGWGPWSVKEGYTYAHAPASVLDQVLALRLHFDDSTEDNGSLRILPSTHTLGVLTDDQVAELARFSTAASLTVAAGGVVAMRPLVIHSSKKAGNERRRRVLHIEYASSRYFHDLELAITDQPRKDS